MKIDLTPIWHFVTSHSRRSRLKILLSILGLSVLGIILGIVLALCGASLLAGIVLQCALYGIISIPFLLLALIPKQKVEQTKEMPSVNKIISELKKGYKKNQKNSRPATTKERYFWGCLLLLASFACFWIGSIAIIGGVFWLAMAVCCFYSRIPVRVQDRKKVVSGGSKSEDDSTERRKSNSILVGIGFIVMGLLVVNFMSFGKFTCSKMTGECEIQSLRLWEREYKTKSILPLKTLTGAVVQSKKTHDKNGEHTMYFVVLDTVNGEEHLFNSSTSSRSRHEKQAKQINQFLNSDQETLEIKESKLIILFPLIFVIIGGFLLWRDLTFLLKKSNVKTSTQMKGKLK